VKGAGARDSTLVILGKGLGIEPAGGIGAHDQAKCGRAFLGQGHDRDRGCDQGDALLFGRVTYEMMEAAWRPSARTGAWPDWMEPIWGRPSSSSGAPHSVRTRVHEYGGGAFAFAVAEGVVIFANDADQRLYRVDITKPAPWQAEPPTPARDTRYAET